MTNPSPRDVIARWVQESPAFSTEWYEQADDLLEALRSRGYAIVADHLLTDKMIEAHGQGQERAFADAFAVLEPFADVGGEGDEDFPDDTPVVVKFGRTTNYSLKLGDFRRVREFFATEGSAPKALNPTSPASE
jgi:hypothetical protein